MVKLLLLAAFVANILIVESATAKCDKNEVFDHCPAPCPPRRCDVDDSTIRCAEPPKPGDPECQPDCRCKDGYARTKEGLCVPRDQCPKCTRPHEVYDDCPPICPPQTCESLNASYNCPNESAQTCKGACRCEPGYYRNKIGDCISKEQCPPYCGQGEEYSYCINGGCYGAKNCTELGAPIICVDPLNCETGCRCKDDYVRDENGVCIPQNQCPNVCTGPDEVYDTCPPYCAVTTCDGIGKPVDCPPHAEVCRPACVCRSGYYRNYQGVCVSEEECKTPSSCNGDPNAVPGCGVNCGRLCSNYKRNDVKCLQICHVNGCDCKPCYVFDVNIGKCVLPEQCTPVCGANEVYSECVQKTPTAITCNPSCSTPPPCQPGCECKENYKRDTNGTCVPVTPTPPQCTGAHEVYDDSPPKYPPQTCESIEGPYDCPLEDVNKTCEGACRCEPGYYRNKIGECISKEQCLQCSGPNEYYSCGGVCDNVCATLSQQNQTYCPFINIKCNENCYCESDCCRNKNNICVPIQGFQQLCTYT